GFFGVGSVTHRITTASGAGVNSIGRTTLRLRRRCRRELGGRVPNGPAAPGGLPPPLGCAGRCTRSLSGIVRSHKILTRKLTTLDIFREISNPRNRLPAGCPDTRRPVAVSGAAVTAAAIQGGWRRGGRGAAEPAG